MGLDMYLERMPRYKNLKATDIMAINEYFSWMDAKAEGSEYANCTLKEWCGVSINSISKEASEFYEKYKSVKYSYWDNEHKYGHNRIYESVGYWRKANAIHKWFVDNVQDGKDDCDYYEVGKEQLEELLEICKTIKNQSTLSDGWVKNGERYANGAWCPIYEEGQTIVNPEIAAELLPTQGGFFFGGTEYDQWYMRDIENTIEILTNVLETTDFNTDMIAYTSSW